MALGAGEGGVDVVTVVAAESVAVEVEGVEECSSVAAMFFVPGEEWAVAAEIGEESGEELATGFLVDGFRVARPWGDQVPKVGFNRCRGADQPRVAQLRALPGSHPSP